MRRQLTWTERLEDRVKREIRVSFQSGKIKWQFKRSDQDAWDYNSPPSAEDWTALLEHAEAWYQRKRMPYADLERVRKMASENGR